MALIFLLTAAAFSRTLGAAFVYDDGYTILRNPSLQGGLSGTSLAWALTTFYAANWHPITWISHLTDVTAFAYQPMGHHLVNILLHALNAALCFLTLRAVTGAAAPAALAAFFFSLHPLRVESVAWVSERKDLLAGFFLFVILWSWRGFARKPQPGRYLLTLGLFALGLMAKPTLVTVPVLLLMLDVWPLRRLAAPHGGGGQSWPLSWNRPLMDKVPFALLAVGDGMLTLLAQSSAGAVGNLGAIPLKLRAMNAVVSPVRYLLLTVWPSGLAAFYPYHETDLPFWMGISSFVALTLVTAFTLRQRRVRPWLMVGWAWFLIALLPALGLVQVGSQAYADRYTYLPSLGLALMLACGLTELWKARYQPARWIVLGGSLLLAVLALLTWRQTAFWKNDRTLFQRALAVTSDNPVAHFSLGVVAAAEGKAGEAQYHYEQALRIIPNLLDAHVNLGNLMAERGQFETALYHLRMASRIAPRDAEVWYNLGVALEGAGLYAEAFEAYARAVQLDPGLPPARRAYEDMLPKRGH